MKIYILRKSLSDIKTPVVRKEYETQANTVYEFISEMVTRNYNVRPVKETLSDCVQTASDDFSDGCIYIVNATQNIKYADLNEQLKINDGDEIMIVKLKYVRGIIW